VDNLWTVDQVRLFTGLEILAEWAMIASLANQTPMPLHPLTSLMLTPASLEHRRHAICLPAVQHQWEYFFALARYHAQVANQTRPHAWRYRQADIRQASIEAHRLTLETLEIS
jgi:hypothetical protein